jgi:aspartate kinase
MDVLVQKYGGSSLSSVAHIQQAARQVAGTRHSGHPVAVVVSARGNTTDDLIEVARETGDGRPGRELDQLLATGETASAALMAMALHRLGVPAVSLTGPQAGIVAVGRYGSGVVDRIRPQRIRHLLAGGTVVVVAGFQGLNADGDVVTLGRGGSDTTAVALAAELRARQCEIYTDVAGVYTADPRVVPDARALAEVDVAVMAEMAFAGARVLHSRSVELAAMEQVEMHVRSSSAPQLGTVISGRRAMGTLETRRVVTAITHDFDVARILIRSEGAARDLAAEILCLLADLAVPVDLVARSGPYEDEFRMGFTLRASDVPEIRASLREYLAPLNGEVRIEEGVGKVSLVGMGLLNRPQYTARMLDALSREGIATSWIFASQLRMSVTVPAGRVVDAVNLLHRTFGLQRADVPDAARLSSVATA